MNKKAIIVISAVLIAAGMVGTFTLAYFTDMAGSAAQAQTGLIRVEVDKSKGITVKSLSKTPTYVRVRVLPEDGWENQQQTGQWTEDDDGYYYYNQALESDVTGRLFPEDIDTEQLLVYAEGLQAEPFNSAEDAFAAIIPGD